MRNIVLFFTSPTSLTNFTMKTAILYLKLIFVGICLDHVQSFHSPRPRVFHERRGYPLQVTQSECLDWTTNSFWKESRSENEIVQHLAETLFPHDDIYFARKRIQVISAELPLVVINDFFPDDLCEDIIQAASGDMKLSTTGEQQSVSKSRTSCTTWLRDDKCEIPVKTLRKRVTRLSGIPAENGENLQVVQYKGNGEKFDTHCDHLDSFNNLECRGRLATCLLYLNSARDSSKASSDEGFIGGSTFFPEFDVGVTPKQGTAVFWFNTIERSGFNEKNEEVYLNVDMRSRHSGEPVTENEKWVCNFWLHPIALR